MRQQDFSRTMAGQGPEARYKVLSPKNTLALAALISKLRIAGITPCNSIEYILQEALVRRVYVKACPPSAPKLVLPNLSYKTMVILDVSKVLVGLPPEWRPKTVFGTLSNLAEVRERSKKYFKVSTRAKAMSTPEALREMIYADLYNDFVNSFDLALAAATRINVDGVKVPEGRDLQELLKLVGEQFADKAPKSVKVDSTGYAPSRCFATAKLCKEDEDDSVEQYSAAVEPVYTAVSADENGFDFSSELADTLKDVCDAYDAMDVAIVRVSVSWLFRWQQANLFTLNYKNKSLFAGLVVHSRRCIFSFSLGMFLPNYKAYVRKRSDRKKDLDILRKLKHKEKKLVKKKTKKIRWKALKRGKATKRFMIRYMRFTLIKLRLKNTALYLRGYPAGLRWTLRELFKVSKDDELVYKDDRMPRWVSAEFYNKYEHALTERALKKRVKKKLTAKRNRRVRVRHSRGERKKRRFGFKMLDIQRNLHPSKYDTAQENSYWEDTKLRVHPLVLRVRRTKIKTRRGDMFAKRELRRLRWRRQCGFILGILKLRVLRGKKRIELRDYMRRHKRLRV